MNIDRNSSVPSYLQLANLLKAEIMSGTYPPGGRLPAEGELVTRSKLSRITVRQGLKILETEGWVVRKQGLGTFVRPTISQELSRVQTITEVLKGKGITPRVRVLGFNAVIPPQAVASAMKLQPDQHLLLIERLYISNEEPVAILRTYMPLSMRDHVDELRRDDIQSETTYTILEQKLGIRIKAAKHTIRTSLADQTDAANLGVEVGDPVLVVDRASLDDDGQVVEYTILRYHWQRYELSITVPRIAPLLLP